MLIDKCWFVRKKCVPLMLLRGYRAAELRVSMVKDNIEMDIKEIAIMTRLNESILINI